MAICSVALAVGIVALVMVVRKIAWHRACGGGGHRGHRGGGRWGRRGFFLRKLFMQLDTTPSQEREIKRAVEELQREALDAREELKASRAGIARAIMGPEVDELAIGEASVKADAGTAKVKAAVEATLRRVHAILDDRQRATLAELLEHGPAAFRGFRGGPYRGAF